MGTPPTVVERPSRTSILANGPCRTSASTGWTGPLIAGSPVWSAYFFWLW